MKKFTLTLMFFLSIPIFAVKLIPVHEQKVMGTKIKVYQIPNSKYLYGKFTEKDGYQVIDYGENMLISQKDGLYYFIGETEKNLTGFVVSGNSRIMVLGVGHVAQGKLLKQAEEI
ncbi:MAG: hypothetical protein ACRC40_03615 [Fusobacteriaceae bacterium]